jgi:hypothetical protein
MVHKTINKLDKKKLNPYWKKEFEKYKNEKFPLAITGKYGGILTFPNRIELFDYYLNMTELDKVK